MGETQHTVEDLIRNCPSTCIFPFNTWLFTGSAIDVTALGCECCRELYIAVMRGEVKMPGADKIRKVLEQLSPLEPGLYAPDVEFITGSENGKIIVKDVKIRGVKALTHNGEVKYIKIED